METNKGRGKSGEIKVMNKPLGCSQLKNMTKNPKSSVTDVKTLSFAHTQLCHHVSLLIGLANEGGGG